MKRNHRGLEANFSISNNNTCTLRVNFLYSRNSLFLFFLLDLEDLEPCEEAGEEDLTDKERFLDSGCDIRQINFSANRFMLSGSALSTLSVVTVSAISAISVYYFISKTSKKRRIKNLKTQLNKELSTSEELVREQLARHYAFLGEDGMEKVRKSFVIIVGLGGVGSHAAHMLVRSGKSHLTIKWNRLTASGI